MEEQLSQEVWRRLLGGGPLVDLALPKIDGRIDLRGLTMPSPSVLRQFGAANSDLVAQTTCIGRGVNWTSLDFSGADLGALRFFDSRIENCVFEKSNCRDWRLWGTHVSATSFRSADLRGAALGPVEGEKRNTYCAIDFSHADLRQTIYVSADFTGCLFKNSRLSKVDFQGSVFTDCAFEGELKEVIFYKHAFRGEHFPPNTMKGVSFRGARLRHVEFRNLDMTQVTWPADDEHIVLTNYRQALADLLARLESRTDTDSRVLAALLRHDLKWAGQNQNTGVLNRRDLREEAGEAATAYLLELVSDSGSNNGPGR